MFYRSALALGLMLGLAACATTEPEAPDVFIPPPEIKTCYEVSELNRVFIPAETKVQWAITMIDNPPYEPIESRVKRTVVVEPAQVMYTNEEGVETVNLCDASVEIGTVGPGAGEVIPTAEEEG